MTWGAERKADVAAKFRSLSRFFLRMWGCFGRIVGRTGRFCRLLFVGERGERDLGGVEELASVLLGDGLDDDSVGDAGDEVTAVFAGGERGHGGTIGVGRLAGGLEFNFVVKILGAVDPSPDFAAALNGGVGKSGVGPEDCVVGCGGCVAGQHEASFGVGRADDSLDLLDISIVRQKREIICDWKVLIWCELWARGLDKASRKQGCEDS